jgi:hypothetical protein
MIVMIRFRRFKRFEEKEEDKQSLAGENRSVDRSSVSIFLP